MKNCRDFSKKTKSSIPNTFNLSKYDFEDDFELWKAVLAPRVKLRKEVDELLTWSIPDDEFFEQRLALHHATRKRLQNIVTSLLIRPIPRSDEISDKPTSVNQSDVHSDTGRNRVPRFCGKPEAVSDRFAIDEVLSANKLQNHDYINLFERELEKLAKNKDRQTSSKLLGTPSLREFGDRPRVGETTHFMSGYKMWRADMQMPHFSGDFGLKVNLFYDDDVLLNEFSKWLKSTRAQVNPLFSPHKVVTQDVLKEWKRMQILPCIDLRLYQDVFDIKLGWTEIGRALYGNDFKTWGDPGKRAKDADRRGREILHPFSFHALRFKETKQRDE